MTDVSFWQAALWLAAWFGTAAGLCALWHGATRAAGRRVRRDTYYALNHPNLWDSSERAAQEAADRLGFDEYLPREDRS